MPDVDHAQGRKVEAADGMVLARRLQSQGGVHSAAPPQICSRILVESAEKEDKKHAAAARPAAWVWMD